ncbi:MAG: oxidoreductase [Tannerella sp.]|jgi:predicted dehydrogenase|nr:oxidoreductase [Tannerella sp.]
MKIYWIVGAIGLALFSCNPKSKDSARNTTTFTGKEGEAKLIVLAPGHFHASLLQKSWMPQVNDSVYIYAVSPDDTGLKQYLSAIKSFNNRKKVPTDWKEIVYTGSDFQKKMLDNQKGNIVILAGNNREKTEYIFNAIEAGLHVLSDKPMAINRENFLLLEKAYANAKNRHVQVYDMMTERYDMLNIIEKELINDNEFFGQLQPGTPEAPAVYMESIHHFYKEVSGAPLIRPAWFYDVEQQGEGIADITTHLIDLLFWKCFPDQAIDYRQDIGTITATHWTTDLNLEQFTRSTQETTYPDYLQKYLDNSTLKVYANGTIHFNVRNHQVSLKVIWNYQAPEGSSDMFMAEMKGTKAILRTVQGKEQNFMKQLYAQQPEGIDEKVFVGILQKTIDKIKTNYPFVSYSPTGNKGEYLINIPEENREGHESHFKYVAESFFGFLVNRNMPEWETPNTLAKYYITTKAVEVAKEKDRE